MLLLPLGWLVFTQDPAQSRWLPPCPLHALTGLYCPGCGVTRAAHFLLHGQVVMALRYNPLSVMLSPLLLWWGLLWAAEWASGGRWSARGLPLSRLGAQGGRFFLILLVAYGVMRNLPWEALGWGALRWMSPPR